MGKYDHIMHLERPVDTKHPVMSLHNRAAQFAPFDALTGFGGRIYETSRLTKERIEISDEVQMTINEQLCLIEEHLKEHPLVTVTYFLPDKTKDGGSYPTITAHVLKIDTYDERLRLENDVSIPFDDIAALEMQEDF
ncbi:MAG: hypothetical protein Q4B26_03490 [Eubacteriales bacterium]|nr:hypothetical protein [Eubacteriales bacterium]